MMKSQVWVLAERIVCGFALVVLSPFLLLAAAAIVLDSGRPMLFRQLRIGRRGVPFELFKFRSMYTQSGAQVTAGTDPRITRVGRVMRKFKLDEFPQLWNVVRGDMELVGPRPEVPPFVALRDPIWKAVLSVRPGITDLASLMFRNEEELLAGAADPHNYYRQIILPQKLALNLEYLEIRSAKTDLKLILLTILYSLLPRLNPKTLQRIVCR